MTKKFWLILLQSALLLICISEAGYAFQLKSRYATLRYTGKELLREFNDEIYLGRSLRSMIRKKNIVTVEDEALAKVNIIIEKAQLVLDMFPNNMHITIVLLPNASAVRAIYKKRYGRKANHIAYYSLKEKTIYISVDDASLKVFAHEVGHAVVDHYFKVRPPYNIHELMAQFTAKHIQD